MKKAVNFIARFTAVCIYFAFVTPLTFGGLALFGGQVVAFFDVHCGIHDNILLMFAVVLLIIAPLAALWAMAVCRLYFIIVERLKVPFIHPAVNVYGRE